MPRSARPDDLMTHVGRRLTAVRQMLDFDQATLGRTIGCSQPRLANYESGIRLADPVVMIRLQTRWQIPMGFIYAGDLRGLDPIQNQTLADLCESLKAAIGAPYPGYPMHLNTVVAATDGKKASRARHGKMHEPQRGIE